MCIMQIHWHMNSAERRGRRNLRCDSGHLIFGAHLRQLLSLESFFSHCQSCFELPSMEPPLTTPRAWAEGSPDSFYAFSMTSAWGSHHAAACPNPWGSFYLKLAVSLCRALLQNLTLFDLGTGCDGTFLELW